MSRIGVGVVLAVVLAGAFGAGRLSAGGARHATAGDSYNAGYLAGREAAFAGYDGGWAYGAPYVITLRRGGPGITYRIASRMPLSDRRSSAP